MVLYELKKRGSANTRPPINNKKMLINERFSITMLLYKDAKKI
jgi:hypothetical protein